VFTSKSCIVCKWKDLKKPFYNEIYTLSMLVLYERKHLVQIMGSLVGLESGTGNRT